MYMLQSEASFDAAHFLKGYDGKCKNIHGHRWRIVVRISGDSLIASGPKKGTGPLRPSPSGSIRRFWWKRAH